jgi:hypothetical protein
MIGGALWLLPVTTHAACTGDCDGSNSVAINELISCVNIALGSAQLSTCSACDANGDGMVSIAELIGAVNNALSGCTSPTPGMTPTSCPLTKGHYTITQGQGGSLQVATFSPFPFPSGGTLSGDVSDGDANCVHDVTVPNPGGFTAPVFCVPALGYLVSVTQTGCGVGKIDSDGGSDFTVTEKGDTSDSSSTCNIPQMCAPGKDASVRIDITVGDGTPDTCTPPGTGNSIISVPVHTLTWQDNATDSHGNPITFPPGCVGAACSACAGDGVYTAPPDITISQFPQILDFTTDTTTAEWVDLDGDGCSLAGAGPASLTGMGKCMDIAGGTVNTVASGTVGTAALPYDLTFLTKLPNTFVRDGDQIGATCASPPAINFEGTTTRCIK